MIRIRDNTRIILKNFSYRLSKYIQNVPECLEFSYFIKPLFSCKAKFEYFSRELMYYIQSKNVRKRNTDTNAKQKICRVFSLAA